MGGWGRARPKETADWVAGVPFEREGMRVG